MKLEEACRRLRENDPTLTVLDLSVGYWHSPSDNKQIGDAGAIELAAALKHNTTLKELYLGSNQIGSDGAIALAAALKHNTTLTKLGLDGNQIGNDGAIALAAVLETNTTLTKLLLGYNQIGSDGAIALAAALKHNTTLTKLGLGGNQIGNDGAIALAAALETNTTLTWLDLWNNQIGNDGARAFLQTLQQHNGSLEDLGLNGSTGISDTLKREIEALAKQNKNKTRNPPPRPKLTGQRFFQHIDEMAAVAQRSRDGDAISIAPILEKACCDMTDFLQLKYYFTAVNAQYRLGTITDSDRKKLLFDSLVKAKDWCISPFYVAMYRVALRYAVSESIISMLEYDQLDVAAVECDIAHAPFIQAMQTIIRQNAARIDRMERVFDSYQQAVATTFQDLQQNLIAINNHIKALHQDMQSMAQAVNDVQANTQMVANAFNQFASSWRFRNKVTAGCKLVTGVLNAVSFGAAGSVLQGVVDLTVAHIADFGDLSHLREVAADIGVSQEAMNMVGSVTVEEMIEHGISLASGPIANYQLNQTLSKENAIVVIAASAAVLSSTVELDGIEAPTIKRPALQAGEPSAAGECAVETKDMDRLRLKDDDDEEADFQNVLPESKRSGLEMELKRFEKRLERKEKAAKLAKELGQDVTPIYSEIQEIYSKIEELDEQIHSS